MNFRLAIVAAAALISLAATPLVVRAAGDASAPVSPAGGVAATAPNAAGAAPASCAKPVRVVYAGYAPACPR
ncbi:MAG: hypothetical protein PGN34_14960 [Methylobacterium frigidaeris]